MFCNNEKELQMISWLGKGAGDSSTVEKFLFFCKHIQGTLIQPETILDTKNFKKEVSDPLTRIVSGDGQGKRNDRLQTICTRFYLHVTKKDCKLTASAAIRAAVIPRAVAPKKPAFRPILDINRDAGIAALAIPSI